MLVAEARPPPAPLASPLGPVQNGVEDRQTAERTMVAGDRGIGKDGFGGPVPGVRGFHDPEFSPC